MIPLRFSSSISPQRFKELCKLVRLDPESNKSIIPQLETILDTVFSPIHSYDPPKPETLEQQDMFDPSQYRLTRSLIEDIPLLRQQDLPNTLKNIHHPILDSAPKTEGDYLAVPKPDSFNVEFED